MNCEDNNKLLFDERFAIFEHVKNADENKVLHYGICENLGGGGKSKSTVCF